MSKMLFKGIDLTDAQQAQIQQISEKYKAQRQAMHSAGGQMQGPPDDATRAKMDAIMTQSHAEYRAILNADQQKIFDQNVAEMKSHMEQRKQKGPAGSRA
jgi:Spy/CpxP family protein refolding chaperone